jgi:uncharacterized protein (DUF4213/DUF364 family)
VTILEEAAQLAKEKLGRETEGLTIERVVVGIFFTGVKLSNGAAGVCKEIPEAVCCPSSAGKVFDPRVKGFDVNSALSALNSKEPIKTAVAIATLNALSASCWERGLKGQYTIRQGVDAQEAVKMLLSASVAIVGALVPSLRALRRRGGTWWVIEQDPRTLRADELPHYIPWDRSDEIIAQVDVLIITGVTLVNHTLDPILAAAKPGAEIALMGPTAGLLPEPLFARGVRVKKPDELLDVLAAGGSGYHFFDDLAIRIVMEREER